MKQILSISFLMLLLLFIACSEQPKAAETAQAPAAQPTAAAPAVADIQNKLIGKWQSVEDKDATIEIGGDSFIENQKGTQMSKRSFSYSADCAGAACVEGKVALGCFTAKGGDVAESCFSIMDVSADAITIAGAGVGAPHKYTRIK